MKILHKVVVNPKTKECWICLGDIKFEENKRDHGKLYLWASTDGNCMAYIEQQPMKRLVSNGPVNSGWEIETLPHLLESLV